MKIKREFWIIVIIAMVILSLTYIAVFSYNAGNKEGYTYGCSYGCYYGLGKDEVPLNFSFDNNQMACILKCVKDYGEWK